MPRGRQQELRLWLPPALYERVLRDSAVRGVSLSRCVRDRLEAHFALEAELPDVYGHFMPTEIRGFADVVAGIPPTTRSAPQAHPRSQTMRRDLRTRAAKPLSSRRERWSRRPDSNR